MFSGDRRVDKAGEVLPPDAPLEVRGQDHPWVSRGGLKLEHALRHFGLSPAGRVCLDIGASTGGFTDVLLAGGAARVHAVDVGHGQLAWGCVATRGGGARADQRPASRRRGVGEPARALVCDASFIGLSTLLPAPLTALRHRQLGGGADQAAIRGRTRPGRQQGRGARPGGARSRLRGVRQWWAPWATGPWLDISRQPDHRSRGQS